MSAILNSQSKPAAFKTFEIVNEIKEAQRAKEQQRKTEEELKQTAVNHYLTTLEDEINVLRRQRLVFAVAALVSSLIVLIH